MSEPNIEALPRNEALERAVRQHRDDPHQWAVYGDWLQAQGSPLGTLVSVMLAREARPSAELDAAVEAQRPSMEALLPSCLRTLSARGAARLAPVFRRGLPWNAGALDDADFDALTTDPLFQFLDRVELRPKDAETLAQWFERAPVLPWRHLTIVLREGSAFELGAATSRLPELQSLSLEASEPIEALEFDPPATLRSVRLTPGTVESVLTVLDVPTVAHLALTLDHESEYDPPGANDVDALAEVLSPQSSRFATVLLEGVAGAACAALASRSNVVVRTLGDSRPPFERWPGGIETAFVVLRGPLLEDHRAHLTAFAQRAGVQRLTVDQATFERSGVTATVLRFSGEGEAPLVPRIVTAQLTAEFPELNALALTASRSNDTVGLWRMGPHVRPPQTARGRVRVGTKAVDGTWDQRDDLLRRAMASLMGFDPGAGLFESLVDELDLGRTHAWLGDAPPRGTRLPLFTELTAQPDQEDDDGEEDDEDLDDAAQWADEERLTPEQFGEAPNPDAFSWEPVLELPEHVRILPGAHVGDDDPADDLDGPTFDASTASPEEVWTHGPVDLPEHHDATVGDRIAPDDEGLPAHVEAAVQPCRRCRTMALVSACLECALEVCERCSQPTSGNEDAPRVCLDCVPTERSAVRPTRPTH